MKKKIILIVMVIIMALSMASCVEREADKV